MKSVVQKLLLFDSVCDLYVSLASLGVWLKLLWYSKPCSWNVTLVIFDDVCGPGAQTEDYVTLSD